MQVIRRGAADIANVYVTEAGGLQNAAKIFAMCEAAGMPCMIGSMPDEAGERKGLSCVA